MSGAAPLRLVVASANPDKVTEIVAVLSGAIDVELAPRPPGVPEVVEDGATLLDNARLKARALVVATGLPAVADDTGLEVDALGGAPGVYSARYAGEDATYADNVAKLLQALAALPDDGSERRARFTTVALVAFPDGSEAVGRGRAGGHHRPGAPRGERLRLRPRVRARRAGTGAPSPRWRRTRRTPCRTGAGPSGRWLRCWRQRA